MSEKEADREPRVPEPEEAKAPTKARASFGRVKRELTDDELAAPAVSKMLIDETERLERECSEAFGYRERYHAADKKSAVLEERNRKFVASEIVSLTCLSVGSAILGYSSTPSLWENSPGGILALVFGGVLVLGGIIARVVQK